MASIFNNFLQQVVEGSQIRDFRHASRIFVDDTYKLSPKYGWLFHVYFDLNPAVCTIKDSNKLAEHGMLVKTVDLPKFNVDTKTLNNYNRPSIVQSKIKYQDLSITFHDDQSNVIRSLWYDYFTYYYRDVDIGYDGPSGGVNQTMYAPSKYTLGDRSLLNRFGYSPRGYDYNGLAQYIQAIRIYSLHQKKFSEYTLVNPMITAFTHGQHDVGTQGTLDHTMTIGYETMLYASGYVTKNTVRGFADLHYDKAPSPLTPLGGGTNSIMGPGGILSAIDGAIAAGGSKSYGSAAFQLATVFQKNKNADLRGMAKNELITAGVDILNGKDPRDRFFIPQSGASTYSNFPGINNPPGAQNAAKGSATSNGGSVNAGLGSLISGISIASLGKPKSTTGLSGANTGPNDVFAGGSLNQVYKINSSGQVTQSVPQPSFDWLTTALKKAQDEKKAKIEQQAALNKSGSEIGAGYAAAAAELPQGTKQVDPGSTVFNTGTNTVSSASSSVLNQTPYATTVVPASSSLAASEAQAFVTNGNPQQLQPAQSYAGNHLGAATNPAPSSTPPVTI